MKAHGIHGTSLGNANGAAPGPSGKRAAPAVKKEKDAKAPSGKPPAKKRKLEQVDEDAGDEEEPIKGEVKSEIKCEDAGVMNVKTENGRSSVSGGVVAMAFASPTTTTTGIKPEPSAETSRNDNDDDDDEVLVVSSNEKRHSSNIPVYGGGGGGGGVGGVDHQQYQLHHHHHPYAHHSQMHMSAQHHHINMPGIHSFDYAANMGYPAQTTPMMPMTPARSKMTTTSTTPTSRPSSSDVLPYGFSPSPFVHNHSHSHDGHGFFWQGANMMTTPHSEAHHYHHHKEDSTADSGT